MKSFFSLTLLALLLLSGCSSVRVQRDYDPSITFTSFKTYAWLHDTQPVTGDFQIDNDLLDQRIRTSINQTLAGKGLQSSKQDETDLFIEYHIRYRQRIDSTTTGGGIGYYDRFYGSMHMETHISDYQEGTLIIDILDRNQKLIWRGSGARRVYEGSNPEKLTQIVNNAVADILKKFP